MVRLKGHFDGRGIVLDEAPPEGVASGALVEVVFTSMEEAGPGSGEAFIERIRPLIGSAPGPVDLAAEHDHYAHGAPKRSELNG